MGLCHGGLVFAPWGSGPAGMGRWSLLVDERKSRWNCNREWDQKCAPAWGYPDQWALLTYDFDTFLVLSEPAIFFFFFFISNEVSLSSVLGQWVKLPPNIPTGDGWKHDFQSMLSQPLAPPVIVRTAQTANKDSKQHSISSSGNTLKSKELWSFPSPWLIWCCCQRKKAIF